MAVEGLEIRRAEPDDCSAIYEMFRSPKVYEGTLQLPYPSREQWRKRITETESCYNLVAVSGEHVIGMLTVDTFPHRPRRRHVGRIGISVTEAWQGKGVGKALMQAGIDLADKWLNLTRLELEVYSDSDASNPVGEPIRVVVWTNYQARTLHEYSAGHRCFRRLFAQCL